MGEQVPYLARYRRLQVAVRPSIPRSQLLGKPIQQDSVLFEHGVAVSNEIDEPAIALSQARCLLGTCFYEPTYDGVCFYDASLGRFDALIKFRILLFERRIDGLLGCAVVLEVGCTGISYLLLELAQRLHICFFAFAQLFEKCFGGFLVFLVHTGSPFG